METIAFLIPTTSRHNTWKTLSECCLCTSSILSSSKTVSKKYHYKFYIGIDEDDRFFNNNNRKIELCNYIKMKFPSVNCAIVRMQGIESGYLTKMWNILFKKAYNDGCDYFFQCGDDIVFKSNGWDHACVEQLKKQRNIGVVGPNTNHVSLLTQTMVSRKHMDIFGVYFPEKIWNWCCDDWICEVYSPHYKKRINEQYCKNAGGKRRYNINGDEHFRITIELSKLRRTCNDLVKEGQISLNAYLEKVK
jgi:hypothetical protein